MPIVAHSQDFLVCIAATAAAVFAAFVKKSYRHREMVDVSWKKAKERSQPVLFCVALHDLSKGLALLKITFIHKSVAAKIY